MVPCLSDGPRFLPRHPQLWFTSPLRLSSCSQPQSSPWGLISEAWASAPSPHSPQRTSRQVSQAGECWSAPILFVGFSVLCPPHPHCCTLLCGSKAPPFPASEEASFPSVWKLFLLHSYLPDAQVPSLFFCLYFFFFLLPYLVHGEFLVFWEVWGLLPAFSRCSVGAVPHVDVFLMYLWRGRWSPHLTPPPSSQNSVQ